MLQRLRALKNDHQQPWWLASMLGVQAQMEALGCLHELSCPAQQAHQTLQVQPQHLWSRRMVGQVAVLRQRNLKGPFQLHWNLQIQHLQQHHQPLRQGQLQHQNE